ncbi:MAG: peptide-methionine (S)-S-oxide reductase MsrA [Thiohalomonadales bacterium]
MPPEKSQQLPTAEEALPGRQEPMQITPIHFVNGNTLVTPFPTHMQSCLMGLGCFWGAEKIFWNTQGIFSTAVGYAGGHTPNPSYHEVCSGDTAHNEVVQVVFDPKIISFASLLHLFWESHDPTQGMRQGNDRGTQYRSGIYVSTEQQRNNALETQKHFQQRLLNAGKDTITTEVILDAIFYYAEDDHQQYLAKNPQGYCGLGGTGIKYFD